MLPPQEIELIQQYCSRHKEYIQLSPEEQNQFIRQAIERGKQVAISVKQDYNDIPLEKLLEQVGITVQYNDRQNQIGNMLVRAKYSGNPPTITIYRKTMWKLLETKKGSLPIQQLEEIALAHELFHHLQINKPKKKVSFPNLTRLFNELAAQSFTQNYLELSFFPLIVDFK